MKTALAIFLAVTLAMVGLLTIQHRELRSLEAALAAATKRLAEVRLRLAEQRQRRPAVEPARAAVEMAATVAPAGDSARTADTSTDARSAAAVLEAMRPRPKVSSAFYPAPDFRTRVGRDPVLRELYHRAFVDSLELVWGALFRSMNFSAEQIEKFKASQWDLEQVKIDSAVVGTEQRASPTVMREAWRQADLEMKASVRALLGGSDERYLTYHNYSQSGGVRPALGELAGILANSDSPLLGPPAEAFAQMLFQVSRKTPGGWAVAGDIDWDALLPQARAILTSTQFEALQAMHTEEQASGTISQILDGHGRR